MNIRERLQTTRRIFLDSAPVIYFAEKNPQYLTRVEDVALSRIRQLDVIVLDDYQA